MELATKNYEEERGFVPALSLMVALTALSEFAENNIDVVAFDNDCMVGYRWLSINFESFRPVTRGFWLKHFITHSVVQRTDEKAVK